MNSQIKGVKMPKLIKRLQPRLLPIKKSEDYLAKKIAKSSDGAGGGGGGTSTSTGEHVATTDELKELLNVEILPPELASSSSIHHPCQGCLEEFLTSKGLKDHMNRLSSQIIFRCFHCNNKEFTFFNMCLLITHLKWSHNISQPNIEDLKNCTKIQALPGSYFKNYDHYKNLNLKQGQEKEFSCESESISNMLNSNDSPISAPEQTQTTLTCKTDDGNLFLMHESEPEPANNYSILAPEQTQTSLYDDLSSSSPIISTTATNITTTASTDNPTILSSTKTISSYSSSSNDQDIVSNQEMEPVKPEEEIDSKINLRNGKSKKESKTAAADVSDSDSGQLDQEIDADDEDDDQNITRNPKQLKFRRRPPERKQPARNSASTSSLSRLTSTVKLTTKKVAKVRSSFSDYKACVHCSIPIPIKSINRHESSCGHLKMTTSGPTSGDHFCPDCNLRFSSIKLLLLHKSCTHLPNVNNIGEDLFICSLLGCSKQFRNIAKLKDHLTLGHKVKNVTRTDLMGMKKSSNTSTTTNGSGLLKAKKNSIGVGIGINKEKTETEMTNSNEEKMNDVKKASLVEKDGNVKEIVFERLDDINFGVVPTVKLRLENLKFRKPPRQSFKTSKKERQTEKRIRKRRLEQLIRRTIAELVTYDESTLAEMIATNLKASKDLIATAVEKLGKAHCAKLFIKTLRLYKRSDGAAIRPNSNGEKKPHWENFIHLAYNSNLPKPILNNICNMKKHKGSSLILNCGPDADTTDVDAKRPAEGKMKLQESILLSNDLKTEDCKCRSAKHFDLIAFLLKE